MKALRVILILFEAISGHHINWRRSKLFPANEVTGLQQLADILSGEMGCFPTVYLKDMHSETLDGPIKKCWWTAFTGRKCYSRQRMSGFTTERVIGGLVECRVHKRGGGLVEDHPCLHLVECVERKEFQFFEGTTSSIHKIRINCLSRFYFWCKQSILGEVGDLVDLIGNI
ncbi:hypothetical protein MTR67_048624 [Solanum verrucosum]|uniref:Secreted protein n=1 Tax=Solanum verrucosum TaxID=315347 RepID=A0AAF0V0Z1_SOLVR|nr:hypothetical protein MTR67_048624 [Solanum verrucosum]